METKFTKGNWKKTPIKNRVIEVVSENGTLICEIDYVANNHNLPTPIGASANADLISAAPDLFKSLLELYVSIDSCVDLTPDILFNARKAIKKAVGSDFLA